MKKMVGGREPGAGPRWQLSRWPVAWVIAVAHVEPTLNASPQTNR